VEWEVLSEFLNQQSLPSEIPSCLVFAVNDGTPFAAILRQSHARTFDSQRRLNCVHPQTTCGTPPCT